MKDPKVETRFQVRVKTAFVIMSTARAQYLVTAFMISNKILLSLKTAKQYEKQHLFFVITYSHTYSYTTLEADLNWQIVFIKLIQLCCDAKANKAAVMY
jgi:hypothetical protein